MAKANSNATLTLGVKTTGTEEIEKLSAELQNLGKKAGDSAPEFQRVADELEQIAQQQNAVDSIQALNNALAASRQEMLKVAVETKKERDSLADLKVALDAARAAQDAQAAQVKLAAVAVQQKNAELLRAKQAYAEYVAQIGGAKSASTAERVQLEEKRATIRTVNAEYINAKATLAEITPLLDELKVKTAAANSEFKAQQRDTNAANRELENAKQQHRSLVEALTEESQAASRLGVDTKNLTAEQNRMARSANQLTEEAKKLKTALESPGAAARTTGQLIENAFGVVGVRSAASARDAITKINQAMVTLAKDSSVSGAEFQRAFDGANAKIKEIEQSLQAAEKKGGGFFSGFADAVKTFGPATLVFNGITAAINALTGAATQVPKVAAEFQTLSRTLTILTGSSTQAAKEMEYLKGVANRVGSDIIELSKGYVKLTAATKDTALEGAKTRMIFESVAGAMGTLGASSAETGNAIMALTQMMSKGVVSQEEWRQQLAERLPGAAKATADQLGLTVAELNKLIETGRLAAEDILPALEAGLFEMYKTGQANDTLIGKWNQFTNALKASANAIGETGMIDKLLEWGRVATSVAQGAVEQFLGVGKAVGVMAAGFVAGDVRGAWEEIKNHFSDINKRMLETAGLAPKTQQSLRDMAVEAQKAGQQFVVMADGTKYATDMILKSSDGFLKFLSDSAKAQKSADDFATAVRKTAEYTRSAGEATITSANALGDETDKRNTATQVAERNAAALLVLRDAEQKVVDVMRAEAVERQKRITDGSAASEAHKQALTELNAEILKRQETVNGLTQQTDAQRLLAESLKVEAETLKDNSARREELRVAMEAYAQVLPLVHEQVIAGNVTQAEENRLIEEARKAKALYVDALKDTQDKIAALNQQKQSQITLDKAVIQLSIEQQRTIYETAKARGDEYTASQALIQIKRLEIELSALTAKAKRAEGEAALAAAAATREELRMRGALTAAKEAELAAQEAGARVKLKEAEIADELTRRLRELSNTTKSAGTSAAGAAGGYDSMATSMNNAADAALRLRGAQGVTGADGITRNAAGQHIDSSGRVLTDKYGDPVTDSTSLLSQGNSPSRALDLTKALYQKGASVAEAEIASKYVGELLNRNMMNLEGKYSGNIVRAQDQQKEAIDAAVTKALELARLEKSGAKIDLGGSVMDERERLLALSEEKLATGGYTSLGALQKIQQSGRDAAQAMTINIKLGNRTTPVNVASQNDANALASLFQQLEAQQSVGY